MAGSKHSKSPDEPRSFKHWTNDSMVLGSNSDKRNAIQILQ